MASKESDMIDSKIIPIDFQALWNKSGINLIFSFLDMTDIRVLDYKIGAFGYLLISI